MARPETLPMAITTHKKHGNGWGWFLVQTLLLCAVFAAGAQFPGSTPYQWIPVIGMALTIASAFIAMAGIHAMRGYISVLPRPAPGSELVTTGIYRWVRHPMYCGLVMLSAGWAIWHISVPALLLTAVLAVFLKRKAALEDQWLAELHPGYREYAERTWCFFLGKAR